MNTIFTIGYEGTDIERFVRTLVYAGVDVLADVRAVSVSRKKGFSKNALRGHLEAAGIRYVHFADLGDPKPGREAAKAGRYDEFRSIYGKHLSGDGAQVALRELAAVASESPTCLMCFERDPSTCHRSIVARTVPVANAAVFDLYGDRPGQYEHATKRSGSGLSQSPPAT